MPVGFLARGSCYESSREATDAYFSDFPISTFLASTGITTVSRYTFITPSWYKQQYTITSAGVTSNPVNTLAVIPVFPPCTAPSEYFADGSSIGLSILAVSCVAWSVVTIKRLIR